ncbi:MAG: hypothetical protein JO166_10290 [Deltaproteobacteria bacterium]|nr:hypothetical protein [Deltaproteobacteria bacterium]
MRAMRCDPDRMTDDEKMDYVCRAIEEYRQEQQRPKKARGQGHWPVDSGACNPYG